jgi:large subunit ribosomal protein L21
MYAIVKTGGKQYRVERGQRLLVERLAAAEGADVALEPILFRSEQAVFDDAGLKDVKVTAKILAHVRGERLRVFKFKPKRGYKRRTGHRQSLTEIVVTDITAGRSKAAASAARDGEAKPASAGRAKPAAAAASAEQERAAAGTKEPKAAGTKEPKAARAASRKTKEKTDDGS